MPAWIILLGDSRSTVAFMTSISIFPKNIPVIWFTHKINVGMDYDKLRESPLILGGDFNAGDIDWESHTVCEHSLTL